MRLSDGRIRKLRTISDVPGEAHELTFSCFRGLKMFSRDRTRIWLVNSLVAASRKLSFEIWAYVIMPEHVHVLIYPTKRAYDTGAIRQSIKQPVAQRSIAWLRGNNPAWLSKLRVVSKDQEERFHFWQPGGGYDRSIIKAETAWASVEYIHNNPARRGLVSTPTDWPWSSARWYEGLDDVVLEMDGTPPDPAKR